MGGISIECVAGAARAPWEVSQGKFFLVGIWLDWRTFLYPLQSILHFYLFHHIKCVLKSIWFIPLFYILFTTSDFHTYFKAKSPQVWHVRSRYLVYIWVALKATFVYVREGQSDVAVYHLALSVKTDYLKCKYS